MIEVICNDRLGKKIRVKCNEDDTVGDLKKLIAAQTGTKWDKIVLKKWYTIYKVGSVSAPGGVQACLKIVDLLEFFQVPQRATPLHSLHIGFFQKRHRTSSLSQKRSRAS